MCYSSGQVLLWCKTMPGSTLPMEWDSQEAALWLSLSGLLSSVDIDSLITLQSVRTIPVQTLGRVCGIRVLVFPSVELNSTLCPNFWGCSFEEKSWDSLAELWLLIGLVGQRAPGHSGGNRWLVPLKVTSPGISLKGRNSVLSRSALVCTKSWPGLSAVHWSQSILN